MTMINNPLRPDRPVLPEWTRWAWASMVEREYWSSSILSAGKAWNEIERMSVVDGVRQAIRLTVPTSDIMQLSRWAAKYELALTLVDETGIINNYSSVLDAGGVGSLIVILSKPENLPAVYEYVRVKDQPRVGDEALGKLLGYPDCCRELFAKTWGAGQVDSTWEQYATTGNANGPVECNMLWRWMNIRLVPHLPCSFQCEKTAAFGKKFRELFLKYGYVEELKTIDHVLGWTTRWSSINGLAEIESQIIKVCTRTDWAPPSDKRYFQRIGRPYVKPSASGWKLNGFQSFEAMTSAHSYVLKAIKEFVPDSANIIDLGCGTGALLRKAKLHMPGIDIAGIDLVDEAIDYAKKNGPGKWITGSFGNLHELKKLFGLARTNCVVYSPNRFLELPDEERLALVEFLNKNALVHIVYAYSDQIEKMPLTDWVANAGFPIDKLLVTEFSNKTASTGVIKPWQPTT